jgi:hypothetical protein
MLDYTTKSGARFNHALKAYAIDKSGKMTRIKAKGIQIELVGDRRILIPIAGVPSGQVLGLATGSIVSGEKDDHSHLEILPACSNVLYLSVVDDRKKAKQHAQHPVAD